MKRRLARMTKTPGLRLVLALGLCLGALYLAGRGVSLPEVGLAFAQASWGWLALAVFSVVANALAKALRWKALLGTPAREIPLWVVLMTMTIAQLVNMFVPGRLGDVGRAVVIGSQGPGRSYALGTVVIEKLLDTLSYALLFVALLFLLPLPAWLNESGLTLGAMALGMAMALLAITSRREAFLGLFDRLASGRIADFLPVGLHAAASPRLRAGLASLEVLQRRADLLKLALLSGVVWGTAVLNNVLVMRALGLRLPLTAAVLLLVGLQAGISLAAVPGTMGVFEYVCVLALGVFGVGQARALSFGVLLHALVLLPALAGGVLSVWGLQRIGIRWRWKAESNGEPVENGS